MKIILIVQKTLIKKGKRNLVLNLMVLIMISQWGKRDLIFKTERNQKIHLDLKNKDIIEEAKIELFKINMLYIN